MGVPAIARIAVERGRAMLRDTGDADEVKEACTGALRPHVLTVGRPGGQLATSLTHVPLQDLSVNLLRYGASVTVSSGDGVLDDYLLTLPVAGAGRFRYGDAVVMATPDRGVIIGPHREFEFAFDELWDQVVVRIDRKRVESVAAALTGEVGPVDFDLALAGGMTSMDGLLESAVSIVGSDIVERRPQLLWQVEQLLIETLLLAQPNNRTATTGSGRGSAGSPRVRKAMDYMLARLGEPMTVTAVAEACGTSVRSLQAGFRREVGTSPLKWLRSQRLERAHALLAGGAPGLSVTDVAFSCGFFHLGEFGTAFRTRYGVTPSAVLAERR
ncbi:AraC family transcriptional regulator [Nocardioides panzhihuensis]|uniref:AraC-like DNA-binding protein n=1 Tax=Nocardioides panzhihuensis TaxID=860243 RepID=A0A7Z0IS51_9ACTN|nr:AraC family transcriptional regulator [Nocardioides panzhihuensis]NYI77586.1 AraC-like DNA-binding protein [Nocardioides panzhihuensis]